MNTSEHDFDFLHGHWRVEHRRLRERLCGCPDWDEFDGTCTAWPVLGGQGNVDDNLLHLPGDSYRAATLRSHNPHTGRWTIWWLDGRAPHQLDVPVVGHFDRGVGTFFAEDVLDGRPIRVRFRWTDTRTASPRWEQAFSADGGRRWEANWTMQFHRRVPSTWSARLQRPKCTTNDVISEPGSINCSTLNSTLTDDFHLLSEEFEDDFSHQRPPCRS